MPDPAVTTMILAGGQGTRLYPLTKMRSKPAVPIGGKFRLIDIPISNSIHSGFRRIYIATQFSSESLHRHIQQTYRFSIFSKDFITVLSAQQTMENTDWYQGTADAVRKNLRFIQTHGDYVLILSGDHLYKMDYSKFVDYHIQNNADITIAVVPVDREAATQFGIMKINDDTRINTFHEKPRDEALLNDLTVPESIFQEHGIDPKGRNYLASMGIYVFHQDVLKELLDGTPHSDFGKEVIPHAISKKKVFAYFYDGYWEDIGTIKAFFEAQIDLARPLPKFNFYDEKAPILTHPRFLPGSKVLNAEIQNALLCEGSIINSSRITNSIIGIRSFVGSHCLLDEVVMMGADYYESPEKRISNSSNQVPDIGIGDNCVIKRAIIDKNVRIGNNVKIINRNNDQQKQGKNFVIQDGIVVIPKNSVIPDNTEI